MGTASGAVHDLPDSLRTDAVLAGEVAQACTCGMTYADKQVAFTYTQSAVKLGFEVWDEEQEPLGQRDAIQKHSMLC